MIGRLYRSLFVPIVATSECAVLRHQQTTGRPLLDQVEPGASGGLRQLAHPHLQIAVQPATQRRTPATADDRLTCVLVHQVTGARDDLESITGSFSDRMSWPMTLAGRLPCAVIS